MKVLILRQSDIDAVRYRILEYQNNYTERMIGPNGATIEGVFYGTFQYQYLISIMHALGRWDGTDYLHTEPYQSHLQKSCNYFAYAVLTAPRNSFFFRQFNAINDSYAGFYNSNGHLNGLLMLSGVYNNAIGTWVFNNVVGTPANFLPNDEGKKSNRDWQRNCNSILLFEGLNFCKEITPVDPSTQLSKSKFFPSSGLSYIRTSNNWADNNDIQFSLTASPAIDPESGIFSIKHDQPDKNSITLSAFGVDFIKDVGYPGKWPENQNYILIDDKGEAIATTWDGSGNEIPDWLERNGKIVSHIYDETYDFIHGDAKSAFNKLYGNGGNGLPRIYDNPNDSIFQSPHTKAYLNPVLNADRYVTSFRASNGLSHYFVIADDINKDNNFHDYDWLLHSDLSYTGSNPLIYDKGDGRKLMVYHQSVGIPSTKISTNAINPYFHVLPFPVHSGDVEPTSVANLATSNGSTFKVSWVVNFNDYSVFRYETGIVSNNFLSSNGKLISLRQNTLTQEIVSFSMGEGSNLSWGSITLAETYGITATVLYSSSKVTINGQGVQDFKIYAPNATSVQINGSPANFIKHGDFVESTQIAHSRTWAGNVSISNDVFIDLGVTLTINPAVTLTFNDNSSITTYGVINAVGSSSQPITFTAQSGTSPNSWGTIKLNGSGASGSVIKYADIKYGTQVEVYNVPNFEISNCNFTDNYKAVYVYNSTGTISDNDITSTSVGHVIDIRSGSTVDCRRNVITKSNRRGFAILYGGGADGHATENDIYGCDVGIGIIWSSFCSSYPPTYLTKNNRIRNCNDGFKVYRLSSGAFGIPPNDDGARNSISGNTRNVSVATSYPSYSASLEAPYNWWGSYPPNNALFSVGLYGNFVYSPALSSDPWSGIPKAGIKNVAAKSSGESNKSIAAFDPKSIYYGRELRFQKKYREAMNFFISYIAEYPDDQRAYVELYNCYSKETANDLITFFTSIPKQASKDYNLLLSYLYLRELRGSSEPEGKKNVVLAEKTNNSIIVENPNTSLSVRAKINNIYIALYNENNLQKASSIFTEITDKTQLSTSMELKDVKDAIEIYAGTFKSGSNNSDSPVIDKDLTSLETPKEYQLLGNYPNPFNPSTTISYNLPVTSEVEITIYDLLGNEVKTFFISSQSAGNQKIHWNGRNSNGEQVASGIYLYHFKVVSLEKNNEVFKKSAKLILLK